MDSLSAYFAWRRAYYGSRVWGGYGQDRPDELDVENPRITEHEWPALPSATPIRLPSCYQRPPDRHLVPSTSLSFRSLNYRVRLPSRPRVPHRIFWTADDDAPRSFDEWLAKEAERNKKYLKHLKTEQGSATRTICGFQFPGIKAAPESDGIHNRFFRELTTLDSYTWSLLYEMLRDGERRPPLSPYQLLLLVLLVSRTRCMTNEEVHEHIDRVSRYWAAPSRRAELQEQIDTAASSGLFHYFGCGIERYIEYEADWDTGEENITWDLANHHCEYYAPLGEENHFFTDRYIRGILVHTLTPPYHKDKRYLRHKEGPAPEQDAITIDLSDPRLARLEAADSQEDTRGPCSINDMPVELFEPMLAHNAPEYGLLVVTYTSSRFGKSETQPTVYRISLADPVTDPANWRLNFTHDTRHYTSPDEVRMMMNLRCVSKTWLHFVPHCFFETPMVFQRFSDVAKEWFIPYGGRSDADSYEIVLRYRFHLRYLNGNPYEMEHVFDCHRDVLHVKFGKPKEEDLASFRGDEVEYDGNWVVRSDISHGLQVRGFVFRVEIPDHNDIFFEPEWEYAVQAFTWKLLHRPQDVPMDGNQYVLDLGNVISP